MAQVGIVLIVLGVLLALVALWTRRRTAPAREEFRQRTIGAQPPAPEAEVDVVQPRPKVADFHVRGEEAIVTFDVPLPDGEVDDVLRDLLLHEAVEVIREKRHTLPISEVRRIVVLAGRGGEPRRVGEVALEEPGELPAPIMPQMLHFHRIGFDPIERQFEEAGAAAPPGIAERPREQGLAPIGKEIRIPKAMEVGLRAQGIDPETMDAGDLVLGTLRLFGYAITPGEKPDTYFAAKGGVRTYIRIDRYQPGEHPELSESVIREFLVDFLSSGADRGMLVSDRYAPFDIYEKERREPRIRFVTRERIQKFVDALALE